MSGWSRVEFQSEYFELRSDSACMNFVLNPADPGYEQRWHQSWKEKGERWLAQVRPILEQRFAMLAAQPDPEWPLVKYDPKLPLWRSYLVPERPPPWRVSFLGLSGPGSTEIDVAFSALPSESARERFKQELVKDLALLDEMKGAL
ncbi:MAG TPA: hypothetical protein VE981_13485 [Planctomycetota bacterium]|nr:hypothetical protein [Planctomycetota bacterium]